MNQSKTCFIRAINTLLIFVIFSLSTAFAQELSQLRIVDRPELVQDGFVSAEIKDANRRICAGIMIVSDMDGFKYQSNNGVVDVTSIPGQDIVYVSPDERLVEVYHSGYEPLKIILSEYDVKLESTRIWKFKITGETKPLNIPIGIITNPSEVTIFIDGENKGTGKQQTVTEGNHQLKIIDRYVRSPYRLSKKRAVNRQPKIIYSRKIFCYRR